MTGPSLRLRPIQGADLPFLHRVYASTREEELEVTGWSEEEKAAFLRTQFQAQHTYYREHYPDARFDVVEAEGEPIGRLYVHRGDADIRVIDIALLTEHRRGGVGTRLMREILAEAEAKGITASIHVERNNPVLGWYRRLGFREIGDTGVYYLMEWRPGRTE